MYITIFQTGQIRCDIRNTVLCIADCSQFPDNFFCIWDWQHAIFRSFKQRKTKFFLKALNCLTDRWLRIIITDMLCVWYTLRIISYFVIFLLPVCNTLFYYIIAAASTQDASTAHTLEMLNDPFNIFYIITIFLQFLHSLDILNDPFNFLKLFNKRQSYKIKNAGGFPRLSGWTSAR